MPNHVTNRVTIAGPAESVAELRKSCFAMHKPEVPAFWREKASAGGGGGAQEWLDRIAKREAEPEYEVFDFNRIIPAPAFIANGDGLISGSREDQTGRNWHRWNSKKWGTKWNAYKLSIVEDEPGKLVFQFDTAWSSPTPILDVIAEWFPELHIVAEYFDEGHCFWGVDTKPVNAAKFSVQEFGGNDVSELAISERNRLCKKLKGYDPAEEEV
ncbi:hypothetical protein GPA19_05190 [Azoarcus indigens]|uniref:YubB ferredoxin-like domain-containing protein n=1 Tax=Azoarcus indigens TaxID=29545 RepID=A0A4R6DX35_9RHOO|nr:hypothetical protein [Azoarcus indigens]NMG64339.1 hypothetical protein [Azoarcus indigens]TDN49209.1 hypothetical protein C7389_11260 [Azoarcus indigens]